MNRDFYNFGLFFIGLYVIAAFFHGIIFFQIDFALYNQQSFPNWLLVLISIALIASLFMLKYFYEKGYMFTFWLGMIAVTAGFCQNILFYLILQFMLRELQAYYIPALILSLGTGFLFGISLIFTKSGKNPWLRTMRIIVLILVFLSIYPLILSFNDEPGLPNSTITQFSRWLSLLAGFEYVPLIMIFTAERRALQSSDSVKPYRFSDPLSALGGVSVLMVLIFGLQIGTQSYFSTHISPATKAIAEPFEARSFINNQGDTLLYRLLKPMDYDPGKQYPLVVCLHGGAGWGTDNYRQFEGSLFARLLSKPENREKYPAFLFVPQCPPGSAWGGLPHLPPIDTLVFETINALKSEFVLDEKRFYVTGHSLGGYGAWFFIGTRPDEFAAAIPVAGEGDPGLAVNMLDVDIWAFHGANDRNVPVSGSRKVIEAIQNAGGNPLYTESPDGGHGWRIVEDTPGVLDWLFSQKRE